MYAEPELLWLGVHRRPHPSAAVWRRCRQKCRQRLVLGLEARFRPSTRIRHHALTLNFPGFVVRHRSPESDEMRAGWRQN